MKLKMVLSIVLLAVLSLGTYIYQNRYSLFKYLPAVENEEQLKYLNGKIYDKNGKPFTGRMKEINEEYMEIYSYKDGELHGLDVIYYNNHVKEIGHWKNGKQNGLFQMFTETGILVDNALFKNGERDGLTEQFYSDNGKLRISVNYKNGVLHGEYKQFYENGNIYAETYYNEGVINGNFKDYYENGVLRFAGEYKNGLQDGTWKYYTENKILKSIIEYQNGEFIEQQNFDEEGN